MGGRLHAAHCALVGGVAEVPLLLLMVLLQLVQPAVAPSGPFGDKEQKNAFWAAKHSFFRVKISNSSMNSYMKFNCREPNINPQTFMHASNTIINENALK